MHFITRCMVETDAMYTQRSYAFKCYQQANEFYSGQNWTLIDDHLNFAMGRQSFHLGRLEESLASIVKALHESRRSASQQSIYFQEFLNIYKVGHC